MIFRPRNPLWLALLCALGGGLFFVGCSKPAPTGKAPNKATAPEKSAVDAQATYAKEIQPILTQFCHDCHGPQKKKADLDLASFKDVRSIVKDRVTWEKVLNNVRGREMPPADKPQPTQKQRDVLTAWLEAEIFRVDCTQPDPGRVTLRRLNRAEYNNTIRDLVGVDFQPAEDFPADDSGYGFDNIGDVLSLPPVLLEKYLSAAERILDAAMLTELSPRQKSTRIESSRLEAKNTTTVGPFRVVRGNGELAAKFTVTSAGEHVIQVMCNSRPVGNDAARINISVDGKSIGIVPVTGGIDSGALATAKANLGAGEHRIALTLANPYTAPGSDPQSRRRERGFAVDYVELLAPGGPPVPPPTHSRIFSPGNGVTNESERATAILRAFARRAFRRPVGDAEAQRFVPLVTLATKQGESFEKGIKIALQAVLVSPHFLFRGELQPEPNNPRAVHPINEHALAARLSYFLWSSMPDDALFKEADQGTLRKNLDAQVRRMLKDPKAGALVENFAGQWLQLRNLQLFNPDPREFPRFDTALRAAMTRETELYFEHIMREDRNIMEFLDSDYTFLNGRLARHYGIAGIAGDTFTRVVLTNSARGGVLTHASVLTLTSNPTRTSPVKRGKWVLDNLLGTPPPPPPPEVPDLDMPENGKQLTGTLRQRMEQHREDPNCATCHARMDPIGFGLENFDGIGAWRDKDGNAPIDPKGDLLSGEKFAGAADLRRILLLNKSGEFINCISEKMLTYALGRGLEHFDKCAVEQIAKNVRTKGFKFSVLVTEIAKSPPFQMRRGEGATTAGAD